MTDPSTWIVKEGGGFIFNYFTLTIYCTNPPCLQWYYNCQKSSISKTIDVGGLVNLYLTYQISILCCMNSYDKIHVYYACQAGDSNTLVKTYDNTFNGQYLINENIQLPSRCDQSQSVKITFEISSQSCFNVYIDDVCLNSLLLLLIIYLSKTFFTFFIVLFLYFFL